MILRVGLPKATFQELKRCFKLQTNPKEHEGWFYPSSWPKTKRLVQNLLIINKNFKDRWLWALGDCNQFVIEKKTKKVPSVFRQLGLVLVST